MRKIHLLLGVALLAFFATGSCAARGEKNASLLDERTAILHIGGTRLGDMIVGADAKLQFQILDKKLQQELYEAYASKEQDSDRSSTPKYDEELLNCTEYASKASRQKCIPALLQFETSGYWDFDPCGITVNGIPLKKEQIYTSLFTLESGRLAPGIRDSMVFGISRKACVPGSRLTLGYGAYSVTITVPKR